MTRRVIYLVRHGQAAYAETEPRDMHGYLTELGQQQARLVADRLAQLPITAIYHSDLGRAVETAELIAKKFPKITLQSTLLLRECIPCMPTKTTPSMPNVAPEKIEANEHLVEQAFAQYFTPTEDTHQHDILVCHGNIIRYLACRALQAPPEVWCYADTHNCGISEVSIDQGGMILVSLNDTGHLPYSMRTFL